MTPQPCMSCARWPQRLGPCTRGLRLRLQQLAKQRTSRLRMPLRMHACRNSHAGAVLLPCRWHPWVLFDMAWHRKTGRMQGGTTRRREALRWNTHCHISTPSLTGCVIRLCATPLLPAHLPAAPATPTASRRLAFALRARTKTSRPLGSALQHQLTRWVVSTRRRGSSERCARATRRGPTNRNPNGRTHWN